MSRVVVHRTEKCGICGKHVFEDEPHEWDEYGAVTHNTCPDESPTDSAVQEDRE